MSTSYGDINHCVTALEGAETKGETLAAWNWVNVSIFKKGGCINKQMIYVHLEREAKLGMSATITELSESNGKDKLHWLNVLMRATW